MEGGTVQAPRQQVSLGDGERSFEAGRRTLEGAQETASQ